MRKLINLLEYQESRTASFFSNGVEYDLNTLFDISDNLKETTFKVSDLDWIINEADDLTDDDEERIENADLSAPILVTKEDGQLVVVDGFHRLIKATREDVDELPGYLLSRKQMLLARVVWLEKSIDKLRKLIL